MAIKNVRRAHELPVLQWLRIGAVAAGVGAAVVAGQGVAVADPGTDTGAETKTEPQEPSANPDPEPAAEAEAEPEPALEVPEDEPIELEKTRTADSPKKSARRATALGDRSSTHAPVAERIAVSVTASRASSENTAATATEAAVTAAAPALPPQATIEITKATPTPPSLARPIRQVVLGVLGLFGFNPNSGSTNNPLLEALWGTYRRIESIIGNQPATARTATITTSDIVDDTVAITGTVIFDDPNGDPLRYSTTQGAHGSVVINPNGTFTYTPTDPHFTGTDTFTITANDDKNFHLHGPLAFLRPNWGHTSSATLAITLDKAGNVAPIIANHTPGSFTVTDANGDPVTLNISQTTKGTVTYAITPDATTPGAHTVTYAYTPTFAARLAASYAGEDDTETFTITATDGTATSNPLSISATIAQFEANTVVATIPSGTGAYGVTVAPDGKTAYVTNLGAGTVSVIDTTTGKVTATITVGSGPNGVAFSPDGQTAYVTNGEDDTVSVIDTVTNAVSSFTVAGGPHRPALTPDGATLYVLGGAGLYAIDIATRTMVVVPAPGYPQQLRIAPDGKTVYFTVNTMLWAVDTATNTVTAKKSAVIFADGLAISPDGGTAYVGSGGIDFIQVLDLGAEGGPGIVLPSKQNHLTISPDGTRLYATSADTNEVYVLDTATRVVVATIPVGGNPYGVAVSPDSALAYVANNTDGTVSVIWTGLASHMAAPTVTVDAGQPDATTGAVLLTVDTADADGDHVTLTVGAPTIGTLVNNGDGTFTFTPSLADRLTGGAATLTFTATDAHGMSTVETIDIPVTAATPNSVIGTIYLGVDNGSHELLLSADGKTAYTAAWLAGKVIVIDTATNTVVTTIAVGVKPTGLALHPDGTTLWVANTDSKTVSVIDTATNTVLHTLTSAGSSPHLVVFSSDGAYAYIVQQANADDANVVVLNTQTRAVVTTIDTDIRHTDVVMTPDGSAIYLSSKDSEFGSRRGFVLVIDTATNTVAATIPDPVIDVPPGGLAVSSDGDTVYAIVGAFPAGVMVIDADTNAVIDRIDLNSTGALEKIAVSPDGSRLLVTDGLDNTLVVVDIASKSILTTIDLPFDLPLYVTFSPDGTLAYVAYRGDGAVSVIATGLAPYEAV